MTDAPPDFGFELPGYELIREIGRGGVSTVYLARHELLDREVAIKVMSPVLAVEEGFNKRFIREGQTVAQLKHPGIVTVYDVAVADHRPFIAMEYLPGGSLKDRIHGPIRPEEAIDSLRTIADSLGYAHSRGVFHRDVKPENILFRDNGDAVLTDFGIAKSDSQETALTSIGVVVGTPRYISPEQAQGEGSDARSDMYALGVIFHEMLTGRPPYDVKGSMSLLYAHINEPIPQLPDELADYQGLLEDLLAKDPEQRIADCAVLVKRLDEPQQPRRRRRSGKASDGASTGARARKWIAAAGLALVVLSAAWIQGILPGGWGPRAGQDFRNMVSRLIAPDTSRPDTAGQPSPHRGEEQPPAVAAVDGASAEEDKADAEAPQSDAGRGLDPQSIYNQAQALLSGRVGEENLQAAAELHQRAASRGHAMSQYYLGVAYGNGEGVPRSEARALHWLRRAADAGVRGAQYNLILARIFGSNPNPANAANTALALAEQKYAPVYRILGWMYNTGTGVDSSFAQSVRWNAKTMVGDITGKSGLPRWIVRRWERRLEDELDKIRESKPVGARTVVR